jgi:hypothetical protein
MNTSEINDLKNEVSSYKVIPFSTKNIECQDKKLIINDRYQSSNNVQTIMDQLGIKSNLTQDILTKPSQNWTVIRDAVSKIRDKNLSAIVDKNGYIMSILGIDVKEEKPLDYSKRLDNLIDSINSTESNSLHKILLNPVDVSLEVQTLRKDHVECGQGDDWQFGTLTTINYDNQLFSNFFLRLICTNGNVTRERISYRKAGSSTNIGAQFLKFSNNVSFANSIKSRVDVMRNTRASVNEVRNVVDCLSKEEREVFTPFYSQLAQDFAKRGFDITSTKLKKERLKRMYTNESSYDIFNLATSLSTHQRDIISPEGVKELTKFAGEMFAKGPDLNIDLVDIYK